MKVYYDPKCAGYRHPGHPEKPERVVASAEALKRNTELKLDWGQPIPAETEVLLRAHTQTHLDRLDQEEDFDPDTPFYPGLKAHAALSAGAATQCARDAAKGELAFSLMRPPGHHATRGRAMGFCYLSNVAIACLDAVARGVERVGILDFDVHHGNGTEAILLNHPKVTFASVHQHPCYPGTGSRNMGDNCFNYPLPPGTSRGEHRKVLASAFEQVLQAKPKLLGISAGFDCYAEDPLAQLQLRAEDFQWLGAMIRKAGIPVFSVLEGGYSPELPNLILAYLKGLA